MPDISLERLFLMRLVVARYGEGDRLRWWNTSGVLSKTGANVYARGFPRTYTAARARVIFTAAATRCAELMPQPSAFHLFRLHPELELLADEFVTTGNGQCVAAVEAVAAVSQNLSLEEALTSIANVDPTVFTRIATLKIPAAARAVAIPRMDDKSTEVSLLAAGFVRSGPGILIVPYVTART